MNYSLIFIILSFIVALLLTALPLPAPAYFFMPDWVVAVLLYWILTCPHIVRFAAVFLMGIFTDILMGAPLGLHSFAYLCGLFPAIRWRNEFLDQNEWIQAFLVFGMLMTARLAMVAAWLVVSHTFIGLWFFLPSVITALLWLLLYRLIDPTQRAEI